MTEIVDIAFIQDQNGIFDWDIADNGDFVTTSGFDSALSMSLLCERRASEAQVPTPRYRRGWIGNADSDFVDFEIGSLIWLYDQKRMTSDTANGIKSEANAGVAWFLEDELVTTITSTVSFKNSTTTLTITFSIPNGPVETRNFELWRETGIT